MSDFELFSAESSTSRRRQSSKYSSCIFSRWPRRLQLTKSAVQRLWWLIGLSLISTSVLLVLLFLRIRDNEFTHAHSALPLSDREYISLETFPRTQDNAKSKIEKPVESNADGTHQLTEDDIQESDDALGEQINPHNFRLILNEKNICRNTPNRDSNDAVQRAKGVNLLIYICSALKHVERRNAIRQTWGSRDSLRQQGVELVFLLGSHAASDGDTEESEENLRRESATHRDIIREDFVDSYYNLSLKAVMGLKWASQYCPQAAYVMKTDDDVYINVPQLLQFLPMNDQRRQRWIGGCIKQKKSPAPLDRNGQQIHMPMGHPPFVAGAGYVISGDIVRELYRISLVKKMIPVEDAYVTAYCALDINVRARHYEGFNCGEPVVNDCDMKHKFVGHHVTPERQHRIWNLFNVDWKNC